MDVSVSVGDVTRVWSGVIRRHIAQYQARLVDEYVVVRLYTVKHDITVFRQVAKANFHYASWFGAGSCQIPLQ